MRFLRLLVLLPALCLGLLGQGHGWVLCQEACGCLALETAHEAHARDACQAHPSACGDCGHACDHDHGGDGTTCSDLALDADHHVMPAPVRMPDLTLHAVGMRDWASAMPAHRPPTSPGACLARGPPPQPEPSLPQVLSSLRCVVMLV